MYVSYLDYIGIDMVIQIRKLNEDELCYYKDMFKDSLIMYTQLQFDIIPIGMGMYVHEFLHIQYYFKTTMYTQGPLAKCIRAYSEEQDIRIHWKMLPSKQ